MFMYAISLQLWLKGIFSKSLEELLFETYPNDRMIEFSIKSQTTLLVISPNDALIAILKIRGTLARYICDGVCFHIFIGDRLDSSNCLKRTLPRIFSRRSSEIFKTRVFLNIP